MWFSLILLIAFNIDFMICITASTLDLENNIELSELKD